MKTIGDTIKALRKAKNLKQGELAKRLKMTSAQLCRIEGSKNAPSIKTLARIARALNVSLSELMSDTASEEPKSVVCSSDATREYGAPQSDNEADSLESTSSSPATPSGTGSPMRFAP
ncbi:MAG: helix-turn-helix domain-containing protein [Kiritimatiellae bacterium]|nr:helix-turn-helix domain-containing protein [Kiritimatiellia bacterium]